MKSKTEENISNTLSKRVFDAYIKHLVLLRGCLDFKAHKETSERLASHLWESGEHI